MHTLFLPVQELLTLLISNYLTGDIKMKNMSRIFSDKRELSRWLKYEKCYLKPKITSDDKIFIQQLFDQMFKNSKYKKLNLYFDALDCIVANLINCGNLGLPLTKPKSIYYTQYKWLNQSVINNILTELVNNGYCQHWQGYWSLKNSKLSFSSKYFPTNTAMFNHLKIKPRKPESYILLYKKNPNKIRVLKPYLETWFTK